MGRDKAWVELNGTPFIIRVTNVLRQFCSEILVVTNNAERYGGLDARLVPDEFPNGGSLGGLYSGVHAAQNELTVAVACDMPFLNPQLLEALISFSFGYDIVIPSVADPNKPKRELDRAQIETAKKLDLHPLHAVYRKTCLEPMRAAIMRNDLRMISFHENVRVRIVRAIEIDVFDPQHTSLWNVNTPQELARAETWLAQSNERKNEYA